MINTLTIDYNKARQAAITQELVEIVSGAQAISLLKTFFALIFSIPIYKKLLLIIEQFFEIINIRKVEK